MTAVHGPHVACVPRQAGVAAAFLQWFAAQVARNAHAARLRICVLSARLSVTAAVVVVVVKVVVLVERCWYICIGSLCLIL